MLESVSASLEKRPAHASRDKGVVGHHGIGDSVGAKTRLEDSCKSGGRRNDAIVARFRVDRVPWPVCRQTYK